MACSLPPAALPPPLPPSSDFRDKYLCTDYLKKGNSPVVGILLAFLGVAPYGVRFRCPRKVPFALPCPSSVFSTPMDVLGPFGAGFDFLVKFCYPAPVISPHRCLRKGNEHPSVPWNC